MESETPDIICITETWLSDEISNDELNLPNYNNFRLDRNRHGGGVLIYVNSSFFTKVILVGHSDFELIIISVSCTNLSFCIGVFYRPPSSAIDVFDRLCTALGSLDSVYFPSFVLVGDFLFFPTCFFASN